MSDDLLIRVIMIRIKGMRESGMTPPPYQVFVPADTNLQARYIDGQDDLGSLEERLLRIPDVSSVLHSKTNALEVQSITQA